MRGADNPPVIKCNDGLRFVEGVGGHKKNNDGTEMVSKIKKGHRKSFANILQQTFPAALFQGVCYRPF